MRLNIGCCFIVVVFASLALPSQARPSSHSLPPPPGQAQLLAEYQTVQPGTQFWVAMRLNPPSGWHFPWKSARERLKAVRWRVPRGFAAAPAEWPGPRRMAFEGEVRFGYAEEILLLSSIQVPESLSDESVELGAELDWELCQRECLPQKLQATLRVPVGEAPAASASSDAIAAAVSAVPKPDAGWRAKVAAVNSESLLIEITTAAPQNLRDAFFYAEQQDVIRPSLRQEAYSDGGVVHIAAPRSRAVEIPSRIEGVLEIENGGRRHILLSVDSSGAGAAHRYPLRIVLLFALLGGVLLNAMPCVFPVLGIKVLGFLEQSGDSRRGRLKHAGLFAAGIMVSTWIIVIGLLILRAGGEEIGWGYQLQSPRFLAFMIYLFVLLGFYSLGLLEAGSRLANAAGRAAGAARYSGSFLSGVLAVLVATPCSAPFMGAAVGAALLVDAARALLIFTLLGIGIALPYVLLCAFPTLFRVLPRPGRWMEVVKELLAFPLFASAVWLLWVLAEQAGPGSAVRVVSGVLLLAFGCWLLKQRRALPPSPHIGTLLVEGLAFACAASAVVLALISLPYAPPQERSAGQHSRLGEPAWIPFTPEKLAELRAARRPIYLDFTAKWCITCQVNKQLVFSSDEVRDLLAAHNVALVQADWTSRDPAITRAMRDYGRASVPLTVIFPPSPTAEPIILPAVLNARIVTEALEQALAP